MISSRKQLPFESVVACYKFAVRINFTLQWPLINPWFIANCDEFIDVFLINQNYNKILKRDWLSGARFEH